jgi:hypothetical protein
MPAHWPLLWLVRRHSPSPAGECLSRLSGGLGDEVKQMELGNAVFDMFWSFYFLKIIATFDAQLSQQTFGLARGRKT